MKRVAKNIALHLPYLKQVILERDALRAEKKRHTMWAHPPGHYYSPIPSIDEIRLREHEIFDDIPKEIPGINLNEAGQLALLDELRGFYAELPFECHKKAGMRYFFENPSFGHGDGIVFYCMIRRLRPKRIIEVGCGYSSSAILDTNEMFFDNSISCTFIEPYPELLRSLLKEGDAERAGIIQKKIQDVDTATFASLRSGDILFIDSTHVTKMDSDVNHIFFRILPHLESGVYIHFHDIFYPFDYPKEWIYRGIAWNEAYLLKAFLQFNDAFEIQFFNSFLSLFRKDEFMGAFPLAAKNTGGSIWLRKA
ncbi:class I SAM-dependent methyltransferase [Candidatus Poribacteria bacterium]|nr:class I SAM-dependent methyltransferase [Candidatus Poribacteria bacterium]